jgi:hypothetical protein
MNRPFEMLNMSRASGINLKDHWNSGGMCIHASTLQEERELLDLKLIYSSSLMDRCCGALMSEGGD